MLGRRPGLERGCPPSPLDRGGGTGFNVQGLGFTFDDEKTNGAALSGRGSGFVTADPGSKWNLDPSAERTTQSFLHPSIFVRQFISQ